MCNSPTSWPKKCSRTVNPAECLCLPTFKSAHTPSSTLGFSGSMGKAYWAQKMPQGRSFTACLQSPYFLGLCSSNQIFQIQKYLLRNMVRKEAASLYQRRRVRSSNPSWKGCMASREFVSLDKKHILFLSTQYLMTVVMADDYLTTIYSSHLQI